MIDNGKARQLILDATPVLGSESVPLLASLQRVLARDIVATEDFPITDISAKDGFALRHACLGNASLIAPVYLGIIGESAAGRPFGGKVAAGQAVRIMTGGIVPEGADTVAALEEVAEEKGRIVCTGGQERGKNIRLRGESLRRGDIVFRKGCIIGPLQVGALASLRRACIYVHRKPVVAIVATGDELTDFYEPFAPGKAICSNLYALAAQVLDAGGIPLCLGIVKDEIKSLRTQLNEALHADIVMTSGGMSKGKYDLIREVFTLLGMDPVTAVLFGKPGKPSISGRIGASLVFGLPGNPTAAMMSFAQFIRPSLLKMQGHRAFPARENGEDESGIASAATGIAAEERASLIPLDMRGQQEVEKLRATGKNS